MNSKTERILNALTRSGIFDVESMATIHTALTAEPNGNTATLASTLDDAELILTAAFDDLDGTPDGPDGSLSHQDLVTLEAMVDAIESVRSRKPGDAANKPLNIKERHKALATRPSLAQIKRQAPSVGAGTAPNGPALVASLTINQHGAELTHAGLVQALMTSISTGRQRGKQGDGSELVARLSWEYPPERTLPADDPLTATTMLTAALTPNTAHNPNPASLIAAGGICEPVNVDYSMPTFATAARPIKDGLPAFNANRGGVRYTPGAALSDAAAATGIWTVDDDLAADPGDNTTWKPCLTLECEPSVEVLVYGVPTCVRLGNMIQRYSQEFVANWLDATNAAAARIAEITVLRAIEGGSVKATAGGVLGAARELLALIDQAAAALRYRLRTPRNVALRVIIQDYIRDLLRADVARSLANSSNAQSSEDTLAASDSVINAWFAARSVNPIWALDDAATNNPWGSGQTEGAALTAWPTTTTVTLFPEGAWVFLDGGVLDVGIVRDSTLNSTNEAQIFVEPFEAVAFRGVPGSSVSIAATLAPTGMSAGTLDTSGGA